MLEERKSDNRIRPNRGLFLNLFPHFSILSAKKQKWISIPHYHLFDLSNKDGMVSGGLRGMQAAFEVRQRSVQDRSSVRCTVKTSASLDLGILNVTLGTGVIFRDPSVVLTQNIDPKTLLGMKMSMRTRRVIHANQYQHGIERDGGEGIGRHPVNLAIQVDGDNGDSSSEAPHCFAKLGRIQAHRRFVLLVSV